MLLLQIAVQHLPATLPPIHITVQQPPGWPVWVTTLFSAVVGAIFGLIGTLLIEYAKPKIRDQRKQKEIAEQLDAEVRENMRRLIFAWNSFDEIDTNKDLRKQTQFHAAKVSLRNISDDRFKDNFQHHKRLVYKIDPAGLLKQFYKATSQVLEVIHLDHPSDLSLRCKAAMVTGERYLQLRSEAEGTNKDSRVGQWSSQ